MSNWDRHRALFDRNSDITNRERRIISNIQNDDAVKATWIRNNLRHLTPLQIKRLRAIDGSIEAVTALIKYSANINYTTKQLLLTNIQLLDADYLYLLTIASGLGYTIPSTSQQELQSDVITSLKLEGLWTIMDYLRIYATDGDADYATLNWANPLTFQAIQMNSPIFTPNSGFSNTGTEYLDANYDARNQGVNYALNDASYGFWGENIGGNSYAPMGTRRGTDSRMTQSLNTNRFSINGSNPPFDTTNTDEFTGMHQAVRLNSANMRYYIDGVDNQGDVAHASTNLGTSMFEMAQDNGFTAIGFYPGTLKMTYHSAGMTDAQCAAFYTIMNTYISSL